MTAEGALGIIPRNSVNRPRLLFQLTEPSAGAKPELTEEFLRNPLDKPRSEKALSKTKQIKVLKAIESVFDLMLKLEDLNYSLRDLGEEERSLKVAEMSGLVHDIEIQLTTPIEGYHLHFVLSFHVFFSLLNNCFPMCVCAG